jgi:hypothetical protein
VPIQRRLRTIQSRNRQVNPQSPDAVSANIVIFNFRTAGLSADDRRIAVLNTAFRVFLKGKGNLQMFFRASPPGHAEAPGGDADRTNRKSRTSAAFSVVSTFTGERLLRRIADFQRIVTGGVATHQNVDIGIGGAVSGTVFGRAGTVGFAIVSRGGWHRHLRTYKSISPVPVVLAVSVPPAFSLNGPKLLLWPLVRLPLKFSTLSPVISDHRCQLYRK